MSDIPVFILHVLSTELTIIEPGFLAPIPSASGPSAIVESTAFESGPAVGSGPSSNIWQRSYRNSS